MFLSTNHIYSRFFLEIPKQSIEKFNNILLVTCIVLYQLHHIVKVMIIKILLMTLSRFNLKQSKIFRTVIFHDIHHAMML